MTTCVFKRQNVVWLESVSSSDSFLMIMIFGADECRVAVPAVLLLAVSPLLRSILNTSHNHLDAFLTVPFATERVLLFVRDILVSGTVAGIAVEEVDDVKEILQMLTVDATLVCCLSGTYDVTSILNRNMKLTGNIEASNNHNDDEENASNSHNEDEEASHHHKLEVMETDSQVVVFKTNPYVKMKRMKNLVNDQFGSIQNGYKCQECDKTYSRKYELKKHAESVHRLIKYKCDVCDEYFAWKRSLNRHLESVHKQNIYKCDVCTKTYSRKNNLEIHIRTAHMESESEKSER